MEYTKRRRYTVNTDASDLKDIYQHDLQMYDVPPVGEIPFVEFQQLGLDRLKLLQHVESIGIRTDLKTLDERKENLSTALIKDGLKYFMHLLFAKGSKSSEVDLQYRRKDHVSHFIVRLSYCQNHDRQMWFINQEVELFKMRFNSLNKEGIEKLLSIHNIDCKQITQEEKDDLREELWSSTSMKVLNVDTIEFYKVPFQKVPDLVRGRRIYLSQGMAYIAQIDLVSLFVSYFRKNLLEGMEMAKNYITNISDDERLVSFLTSLPGSFSEMTRIVWSSTTTPVDKLDELSKTSYPLCMRTLHEALKIHHHLRNSGRIQYGLFIKGIGVTMDDAMRFWKMEFTKKIDPDKFDKQYTYSIRHIFGKEGKQTNYTPLGCTKIITSAVGPGEYHGCPYRHMDNESLKQKLSGYGLPAASVHEISDLAKNGHYHLACTKYFETVHTCLPERPIIHPNGYFMESRAILTKDNAPESENNEKLSQHERRFSERVSTTPIRRLDRNTATPRKSVDRVISSPSIPRSVDRSGTPTRKVENGVMTPVRAVRNTPKRMEAHLNDDEIAELVDAGL